MFQETLTIARHENGYGGIGGIGITPSGKKIAVGDFNELSPMIDRGTRIIDNPPTEDALSAPWKAYIDPTLVCGLKCGFCLSSVDKVRAGRAKIPFLKIDQMMKINDQLIEAGVLAVKFGGGEPFIYGPFWESVGVLAIAGIAVSVSTSGVTLARETLLPDSKIETLKKHRVKISISVDGEPNFHNAIRGRPGLLEEVLGTGMSRLIKGGINPKKIEFRSTISKEPQSIRQLEFLDQLSLRYQTKTRVRIARPYGSAGGDGVGINKPTSDIVSLLLELRLRAKSNPLLNIDGFLGFDGKTKASTGMDCRAGTRSVGINARGEAVPCGAITDTFPESHSLLAGKTLLEVWQNGSAFKKVREWFKKENATSPCRDCGYVNACQGGCPSVRLSVGKEKNPLCPRELNL
jgi:radical SAM protein with 4Fe4S-binding SPASM domain